MNVLAAAPNIATRPVLPKLIVEIPPQHLHRAMLDDVAGWDARAEDFDAVGELLDIAQKAGRSPVSLALNWLLHHSAIDCVILGASKREQLEENLKAMEEGPLSADAVAACDQVWAKIRGVSPQYNR